jgi:DNA-binding beta-propeller fold protein YncE
VFVSAARDLLRVDGAGAPVRVAEADADIGPLAISPGADVYFAAGSQVFVLRRGSGPPALVTSVRFSSPHGLAAAADGSLLVSDTGNDTVWRIDPGSGATTTFAAVGTPRGLDVAPDGSVYVVDARDKRIVHLSATGGRLGLAGPAFADPYDLDVAPDGAVYVVDTAASGRVFRVMGEIAKPLSRR